MAREMDVARRDEQGLTRPDMGNPFRQFADEVDRMFDDFALGRGWLAPKPGRGWLSGAGGRGEWAWAPEVEVFYRGKELVVRADLPGLTRNDIKST